MSEQVEGLKADNVALRARLGLIRCALGVHNGPDCPNNDEVQVLVETLAELERCKIVLGLIEDGKLVFSGDDSDCDYDEDEDGNELRWIAWSGGIGTHYATAFEAADAALAE